MADLLLDPRIRSILGEGRQAFVAVAAKRGPHVTPELYAVADGRIWLASAASTLKVKVLDRRPTASVVVRVGNRAAVIAGEVEAFDPFDASGLVRATRRAPSVVRALAHFGLRNASDLAGFAVDAVRGQAGRPPGRRVLIALEPARVALVEGGNVAGAWGDWPGAVDADAPAWDGNGSDAVVGWASDAGPLALPANWDPEGETASVPPALATLAGLGTKAPACVVVDEYGGPGPAAKQGVLLRGDATRDGGSIRFSVERVTTWDGIDTDTAEVR